MPTRPDISPEMARQVRTAQYDKEHYQVLVRDIPIPEPKEDQLQVKMTAVSLFDFGLTIFQRSDGLGSLTIGHEGIGVVSKIQPSVEGRGFQIGDTINMLCIVDACYECERCRVHGSFCTGSKQGWSKIQGLAAHGVCSVGLEECDSSAYESAVERMSPLFCAGSSGSGGLGQLAVRCGKGMDLRVCCLDVEDKALDRAKENGADAMLNPQRDPSFVRKIRQLTQSRGCHAAAVFSDAAAANNTAQRILTFNGLLMVMGIPDNPLKFPAFAILTNLTRVKGAGNGTAAEMKKAVDFTAKHHIVPEVQSRRLEEMPQMWWKMANGKATGKLSVSFVGAASRP